MIITDGTCLLVSRVPGEQSGIKFPNITSCSQPILALAVDEGSYDLGEDITNDNAEDEDFDLGVGTFMEAAKALGLKRAAAIVLVPGNAAQVYRGPDRFGDNMEHQRWRSDRIGEQNKVAVIFDDGTVFITDRSAPGRGGVVACYEYYIRLGENVPRTYDLFNAATGELIENASV